MSWAAQGPDAGREDAYQLVCFIVERPHVLVHGKPARENDAQPKPGLTRLLQHGAILEHKIPAGDLTFCLLVYCRYRSAGVGELPVDLSDDTGFHREFSTEQDDLASKLKRAFSQIKRFWSAHGDSRSSKTHARLGFDPSVFR